MKRALFGAALSIALSAGVVVAAPVSIEAVLTPQEQMKFKFADGTGKFSGKRGVGSLVIKPAGGPKRKFILVGEVSDAP